MSHFKLLSSTKASDVVPVSKYVSEKTGITVIIGEVEGPIVNGFFSLATEAHDDNGVPHTLEHLIFLGSARYPYKGVLDLLANRCMAHGTNAWTDTDHTCYTVYTAGHEGMLTLLPIYLDHILFPTLTEQGFLTEVHHVDGEGQNAGVLYCEMQGRENSADSRCNLQLIRKMYPDSGYSSETGGILKNLREFTDNTEVRNFHKKFYRPENLQIILTGQIKAEDVFKALSVVEDDIIAKRASETVEPWVKPWQTIPPPSNFGMVKEQWPADVEDCGVVMLGWRGPLMSEPDAIKELTACATLLRYLCDLAVSPLQRCLVEREDALAGDVTYSLTENLVTMIKIDLNNVPVNKLEEANNEAIKCLKAVRAEENIDLDRIQRLLKKQLRESNLSLETDPHHVLAFRAIGDQLYSQNELDFFARMNPQVDICYLMEKPSEYWVGILRKYFTDDIVTIVGSPSIQLHAEMAADEKKRIDQQRQELGETGLADKAKQLQNAVEYNERPPLPGSLASVPIPSCDNLKCHNIAGWSSDGEPCPYFDLKELPIYARVHNLKTNFVYINLLVDTSALAEAARKWIPIQFNAFGECPVRRGAELVPHADVIAAAEHLTATLNTHVGFGRKGNFSVGEFVDLVHIETKCEPEYYEQVVNYLYEIMYAAEITKERLLVFAQRLINDVAQARRNGNNMVFDTLRDLMYRKNSNPHWCTVLRQHRFLKELVERLGAGGDVAQAALDEAKAAFADITRNVWIHLAADFERFTLSPEPWKKFARENEIVPTAPPQYLDAALMEPIAPKLGGGFVMGVGGIESSFVAQLSPAPLGYEPAVVAPLLVALNYFTQLEGPMWRLIRGCGLSYGYGMRVSRNEGLLLFTLYRAANAITAYYKAQVILESYSVTPAFNEDLFASAKSTALFEVVDSEKCIADVAKQSLMNYLQRVDSNYMRDLICALTAVTPQSAAKAFAEVLPSLLSSDANKLAIVCHPTLVQELQRSFGLVGVQLDAYESMEVSHFNEE